MSSRIEMNDERLHQLIEAYGASSMAWPDDERDAAEAHLAANPDRFAGALASARELDALFENDEITAPPATLADRILGAAPAAGHQGQGLGARLKDLLMPNGLRWPASAALASLGMGLFAGYTASAMSPAPDYETEAEMVVYSALGYGEFESFLEEDSQYE
jgi:hypothetical protein